MTTPEQAAQQAQDAAKVVDMAQRAFDRNRPLFIMVQYNHEADKLKFIDTIGELIQQHQLTTRRYDPLNNTEHGVSKLYPLLKRDRKEKTLSLVVSMPREKDSDKLDNEFVSYINLYRDFIAQQKLHFVLFLSESEMGDFIGDAGDLWSFRHRTFRLERELTKSTDILWQNVEQMQTELTFSDEENQLIKNHLRSTKQLIEETEDKEDKAELWLGLTRWLIRHNAPKMAIEMALEGISILDGQICDSLGSLENNLGYAFRMSGAEPEALEHYKRALEIAKEAKNQKLEGTTLNNISQIHQVKGDYDTALQFLSQSLTIQKDIEDKKGEGITLNNISQAYDAKGDYDTALQYLNQALSIDKDIGDKQGEGTTLNNIAQIHKVKGDYDAALQLLNQSLSILKDIG
ncbi:MAG: tetratricopeptide repeat protein, partial [Algicola sp.]|nr:tetratricopeptide repeat protein [Algicola sp.]